MTRLFDGWNCICQVSAHDVKESKSACNCFASPSFSIVLNKRLSSAKSFSFVSGDRFDPRSLMKIRKHSGPRTVPCGTPDTTLHLLLVPPSRHTSWVLKQSQFRNHLCSICGFWSEFPDSLSRIPLCSSLCNSLLCGMVSHAFAKSKIRRSICFPLSSDLLSSSMVFISCVSHCWRFKNYDESLFYWNILTPSPP